MDNSFDHETTAVYTFKNDDKYRVVLAFGALFQNTNSDSDCPEVEVLLSEVCLSKKKILNKFSIVHLGIVQIDIVRLGSVWKGRNKIKSDWAFENNSRNNRVDLSINLSTYEPKIVKNFFLEYLSKISSVECFKKQICKDAVSHFINSPYVEIVGQNGKILISVYEVLTSLYTLDEPDLRKDLLSKNIETILSEYCSLDCEFISENNTYQMKFNKKLGITAEYFLAYLKFNKESRKKVSKIWNSLNYRVLDSNGYPYLDKYPEIVPYFPKQLKFTVSGIGINNEAALILRVDAINLPEDFKLNFLREFEENKIENNTIDTSASSNRFSNSISLDAEINNEKSPINGAPTKKSSSKVIINRNKEIEKEIITKKKESSTSISQFEDMELISTIKSNLSSSKPNYKEESKDTGKAGININISSTEHKFNEILKVLKELKKEKYLFNKRYILEGVTLVDSHLNEIVFKDSHYPTFKGFVYNNYKKKEDVNIFKGYENWFEIGIKEAKIIKDSTHTIKYRDRGYLLLKLYFSNGKYCFLFEIDTTVFKPYSGLVFVQSYDYDIFKKFIESVILNEGKYKVKIGNTYNNIKLDLYKYKVFKHTKYLKKVVSKSIESVI